MTLLKRFTTALATLAGGLCLAAPSLAAETLPGIPEATSLNGEWRFKWTPDAKAADEFRWFHEEGFDSSDWDTIRVPSNWTMEGFEEPHYVDGTPAEGFYVKTFTIPEGAEDLRTLLHFEGVWMSTEAWLNGKRLGRHESGFTAFAFDISHELKAGEENTLSVRVRQQVEPDQYKFDANDDWALPGIYRDVWIEYTPREMVMESVEVETDFDRLFEDAELQARVFVARWESADFFAPSDPFDLRMTLSTPDGEEVATMSTTEVIHGAHNGNDFTLKMDVRKPKQWTAETPDLYDLTIELVRDGEVADRWQDRIGFREVSTEGGVLRVNGQVVKLRGVARHDQHPDVGRATRREHWVEDIKLMKEANINTVRTAHYPPAEGFVRLCDELGLYVINEIPLGFGGDRFWDPSFSKGMYVRIHETIMRDRNRPSVIVWSFGNEDPFSALHLAGLRTIKGLDDTRPTLLPFRANIDLPKEVDILAPHYWKADEYDALAAQSTRPVVTTEYTHALGPDDFGEFGRRWDALTSHPAGAGGMIWAWADQGLRRSTEGQEVLHPLEDKDKYTRKGSEFVADKVISENEILDSHGNQGTDGIVDADREPQRDYWETKAVYSPVQVLDEWLPLDSNRDSVHARVYNGFDFLDLSTVMLEWKLYRDDLVIDSGEATLEAVPHATARLEIPTTAIKDPEEAVHYVHVIVRRPDNSVMVRESVRLGETVMVEEPRQAYAQAPTVEGNEEALTISIGPAEYSFANGEIDTISVAGDEVVEYADIAIWRASTHSERNRLDRRDSQHDWNTYMQGLDPELLEASVEQGETVTYTSRVEYRADEANAVVVDYTYQVHADGSLEVDYTVQPDLDVEWIPEVGILLKIVDEPLNVAWQGEGVMSSMPGKTDATIFGQWDFPVFSGEARGTKVDVDWLRIYDDRSWGLRATGMSAFRLDGVLGEGSTLRLLSHVAAAWTKNGPGERPDGNLPITDSETYSGSARLVPLEPREVSMAEAADVRDNAAVLESSFINPDAPYASCHASTLAETTSGQLVAAWFGGTRERHPDVGIWFARQVDGEWQEAVEVANGVQEDGSRHPTWNPVLFQPKEGPLHLFYKVGPSPGSWWGMLIISEDDGRTWSEPRRLPEGILGPIKNKPIELADGTWLSPSSTEGGIGWRVHIERSTDQGETWEKIGPVDPGRGFESIQPSILVHGDGVLQTLNRTKQGVLSTTWSYDNGETWTPMVSSGLPNPGSGTDAVTLQDGRHLLVYNHSSPPTERPHKGVRYPLNVAISSDGKTWDKVLTVESVPRSAGYAYPSVIQAEDGTVHISYTFNRDVIKHVAIDPTKL